MHENIVILNQTGREIDFNWQKVLENAQTFVQESNNPCIWDFWGLASVSVHDKHIAIHPGKWEIVDQGLDILAVEIGRYHHCEATIDKGRWPEKLTIFLGLKDIPQYETVRFGHYPQTSQGDDRTPIDWIVLNRVKDTLVLLSKHALHTRGYWNGDVWNAYENNGRALLWE